MCCIYFSLFPSKNQHSYEKSIEFSNQQKRKKETVQKRAHNVRFLRKHFRIEIHRSDFD